MMRGWAWRAAAGLAAMAIGGYAAICLYMYRQQDQLIYPGGTVSVEPLPAPDAAGLAGFAAISIDTPDGQRLKGWWRAPDPGHGVVLYLQGNAHTLADRRRIGRFRDLAAAGFGVLGIQYRGFGGSTGHPSQPGLVTDAETAYVFVGREAPGAKIALFADSLGTAVAVALAAERPVAGLVLDSPFASMLRLASASHSWLPVSALLKSPWDSEAKIKSVHAPLLIAQCDADKLVPPAEGRRLFDAANQPKDIVVVPGCGHVETWADPAKAKILTDLESWLAAN
jgi:fermentation-respiration switch protein FrsA (DUF1100 family)